jgi:tetrapyrrole methylase family protein/MazG family protein
VNEGVSDSLAGTRRLIEVVARLRAEGGCPWDREQTLSSLKPFVIEEAYELNEAVDSGDPDKHAEELGDVLLQVALHARIREEAGRSGFDAVAGGLADKLVRRHPHVFGDSRADTSADVLRQWDWIKAGEAGVSDAPRPPDHGVPRHLPALERARKIQGRAAREGFDWPDIRGVGAKVEEELHETLAHLDGRDVARLREEIGDLLFAVVNLARFAGINAEEALNAAVAKFVRRYTRVQQRVAAEGRRPSQCTLAELDAHWEGVKREERGGAQA